MVTTEHKERAAMELHSGDSARILIIEAPYYQEITDELGRGVTEVLDAAETPYDWIAVPGALEIPQALAQAAAAGLIPTSRFAGAIALGCVIRGETTHYEIVSENANHWLMELAVHHAIPVGNAILTCETKEQAMERARGGRAGKGGDAARACLGLIELSRLLGEQVS